jgi:uncharacterized protein YecE (DUF72 family)
MSFFIGTSGFSYDPWKGPFYPEDIKKTAMLSFYASRFNTVEINNTFYRMPTPKLLEGWGSQVPDTFRFVIKTPQRITHIGRLKEVEKDAQFFFETLKVLDGKLGPVLVQLPPNLKVDLDRLNRFLDLVPADRKIAFEFGNVSWNCDEVFALLRGFGRAALVLVDDEKERGDSVAHVRASGITAFGYARLRKAEYGSKELATWQKTLRELSSEPWVFFKHEDEGKGPAFGLALQKLFEKQ